jgi:hypothetical protein
LPGRSPVEICPNRYLMVAESSAPALLLDVSGDGAMRIGAVATLGSGNEKRRTTQRWARRIYEDLPRTTASATAAPTRVADASC